MFDIQNVPIDSITTLVLNADFSPVEHLPLSTWSWKEAIHATCADRVMVVTNYDRVARSQRMEMPIPSVVALREFVQRRRRPSLTRTNLITLRDKNACCYCGGKFSMGDLTYDHFIPRAQGGKHSWENVVGCCLACNQAKRDRTPSEAKMTPHWRPWTPTTEELARADYFLNARKLHESWKAFIPYAA